MLLARLHIEQYLTNTASLSIFYGAPLAGELEKLAELAAEAPAVVAAVMAWHASLGPGEMYRRSEVQNRLLDLWAMVVEAQASPASLVT